MPGSPHSTIPPADVSLLLRVHAERAWLNSELATVLSQLEARAELDANELQAALAYLEVTCLGAALRGAETDDAHARLGRDPERDTLALAQQAFSYYSWLRLVRAALAARVEPFLGASPDQVFPAVRR